MTWPLSNLWLQRRPERPLRVRRRRLPNAPVLLVAPLLSISSASRSPACASTSIHAPGGCREQMLPPLHRALLCADCTKCRP